MSTLLRAAALAVIAAPTVIAAPAVAGPPPTYFVDESKLPFGELSGVPTTRYWGVHNNAGYRIEVPHNWNGSLVTKPCCTILPLDVTKRVGEPS